MQIGNKEVDLYGKIYQHATEQDTQHDTEQDVIELNVIEAPITHAIELNVTEVPITLEELYVDTEQEKERILSKIQYLSNFNGFSIHKIEQDSNEELNIDNNSNLIINQEVDKLLAAFDIFYRNDCSAFILTEHGSLDFGNGIKALLAFSFIKDTTEQDNIDISLYYGWTVDDNTQINQDSLNNCYSYITKRFMTTLDNFNQIASSKGLKIETTSRSNEGIIVSDYLFDNGLSISDTKLYRINITKTS